MSLRLGLVYRDIGQPRLHRVGEGKEEEEGEEEKEKEEKEEEEEKRKEEEEKKGQEKEERQEDKEEESIIPALGKLRQDVCYEFQASRTTVRLNIRIAKTKMHKATEKESRERREINQTVNKEEREGK